MENEREASVIDSWTTEKHFYFHLVASIMVVVVAFLFVAPVFSQEEPAPATPSEETASVSGETVSAEATLPVITEETSPSSEDNTEDSLQSETTEVAPAEGEPAVAEDEPVIDEEAAEAEAEVEADAEVTNEDLGVSEASILPDSPLYGIKRFGRKFREFITIDPVKKAEVRLKHASQELADAGQLLEKAPEDAESIAAVATSVEEYTKTVEDIKENIAAVAEEAKDAAPDTDKLLEHVLDKQIKHQKVFEKIEEHILDKAGEGLPTDILEKIRHAKEESNTATGEMMVAIEADPTKLAEKMDQVLESQSGSQFKDLRNVEVLKGLEDFVPEEAKAAIRQAQENSFKRFSTQLENIHPEKRGERFESYVRKFGGDRTRQMEIFDDLKQFRGTPTEVIQKIEAAKDIAAKRFQEEIEALETDVEDPELREKMRTHMLASFEQHQPDVKKLRAIEEIQKRAVIKSEEVKAEIKKHQDDGIEKFKASFPDSDSADQVARFQELSRQMAENPDPTTFRLIQELEEKVKSDPKKREFMESMEREAKAKFLERAQQDGEEFFNQIASTNPDDIEVFKKLKEEFAANPESFVMQGPIGFPPGMGPEGFGPPGLGPDGFGPPGMGPGQFGPPPEIFRKFFDQAIQKQTDTLTSHIENIENPDDFANFQERFQGLPPEIAAEIEKQKRGFGQIFNDKRRFILEKSAIQDEADLREQFGGDEAKFEEERKRLFEERFQGPDIFCDAACQEREKQHIESFRGQFIGGGPGGPQFDPRMMMEKFGSDPAMRVNIERMMQGPPQGEFVPQGSSFPRDTGEISREPSSPKPFVDESGSVVPDHKIEEVKARMREAERREDGPAPEPEVRFFRDGAGPTTENFQPPKPPDGQLPPRGEGFSQPGQFPPGDRPRFDEMPSDAQFRMPDQQFNPPQFDMPSGIPDGSFSQPKFDAPPQDFREQTNFQFSPNGGDNLPPQGDFRPPDGGFPTP